jgi:hypothetical protein
VGGRLICGFRFLRVLCRQHMLALSRLKKRSEQVAFVVE